MEKRGSPDKRGKNKERPREIPPEVKSSVHDHLNALARQEAHYVRANSKKDYLTDTIKTFVQLYELYLEWLPENRANIVKPATSRQYSDIFNFETNISFFIPKKDRCDTCTEWENCKEEDKEKLRESFETHIANQKLVQELRRNDVAQARSKDNTRLCVACFDYEKVLSCPQGRTSIFYYRRKLSVSNFTISDEGKYEDFCFVYDETIAKKGANEVASFLLHFIEKKVTEGIEQFILYSDNCAGQNKNYYVPPVFMYAAAKYDVSIIHRFLEKGHSYNAADKVHSLIERKTRPHDIFTPAQWYELIKTAKRCKTNPLKVIEVTQDMVHDVKQLASHLNFSNIPWTKVREVRIDKDEPFVLKFRCTLTEEALTSVNTRKVGHPVNFMTYRFSRAHHSRLLDMCKRFAIPLEHHDFYNQLPVSTTADLMEPADENEN